MPIKSTPSPSHLDGTICFALKGGLTYGARLSARVAKSQKCASPSNREDTLKHFSPFPVHHDSQIDTHTLKGFE